MRKRLVRVFCPDPRYNFTDGIDFSPNDLVIPAIGVSLGGARDLPARMSFIPELDQRLTVFSPHSPCAAVPDPVTAQEMGSDYADSLHSNGFRAISLFLGEESVDLYDPMHDISDDQIRTLYADASAAQRKQFFKNPGATVSEVAIAPYFDLSDMKQGVLHLSGYFFSLEMLRAIKRVLGGEFPHRNYCSSIPSVTQHLFEAAFAAA